MIHSKGLRLVVITFVVLLWGLGARSAPSVFAAGEPSNDDPTQAVVVTSLPYSNIGVDGTNNYQDTTQACIGGGGAGNCDGVYLDNTTDPGASTFDKAGGGPSCLSSATDAYYSQAVWYQWTATFTGEITVDTLGSGPKTGGVSNYDVMQDAFTNAGGTLTPGGPVGAWTEVTNACNDDTVAGQPYSDSTATFAVTSGTTYYLMFATFNPNGPPGTPGPAGILRVNIEPHDLTFNPTLPDGGSTINAIEGQALPSTQIGSFTDNDGTGNLATDAANYSVSVDWGDGVVTSGVTTTAPGADASLVCDEATNIVTCRIYSTHIYAEENVTPYNLSVSVTDSDGTTVTPSNYANVKVADAPLTQVANANPPAPVTEGIQFSNITLGTFQDAAFTGATGNCDAADYSATVTWGDGTTDTVTSTAGAAGQIVSSVNGSTCNFDVLGTHTYPNPIPLGGESIQVTVTDGGQSIDAADPAGANGGSTVSWTFNPDAQDAPLTQVAAPNLGTSCPGVNPGDCVIEGTPFTGALLATFNDTGGTTCPAGAGTYSAIVGWGDGDHSALNAGNGGIIPSADGNPCHFDVIGGHTYAHTNQSEPITVTISDVDGQTLTITGTAVVSPDQPLQTVLQNQNVTGTEGAALNNGQPVFLGTFHDSDPGCVIDDYQALITWDTLTGATSTATPVNGGIVPANDGTACDFKVFGSTTYVKAGLYDISVLVQDEVPGAPTPAALLTLNDTATIADAALTGQQLLTTYNTVEGIADNNRVLGTVTDADPNCSPNNLTVTINWGDGTPLDTTSGTLNQHPGTCTFDVVGSHAFLEETPIAQPFQVLVTIADIDPPGVPGSTASFADTTKVTDAPLVKVAGNGAACGGGTANCLNETAGAPFSNTVIGTFTDTTLPGNCDINDYTATVNWGDAVANPQGNTTTLTYANGGIVPAPSGGFAGGVGAVAIASVPVPATTSLNGPVTSISIINPGFGYSNPPAVTLSAPNIAGGTQATAFATVANGFVTGIILINQGSGYTAPPMVTIAGPPTTCSFNLVSGYKYMKDGTYDITIKVMDQGGQSIANTVFDVVTVADAPITIAANSFNATEGAPTGTAAAPQLVATFTDADPSCALASYSVSWINWGDGTGNDTSTGTIKPIAGQACTFGVYGTHTYAEAGSYLVDVMVADAGGASAVLTAIPSSPGDSVATVKDAALSQVGPSVSLSTVEGQGLSNQTLASFTDADPGCGPTNDPSPNDYTATVDWGDGTPTNTLGDGNVTIDAVPNGAANGCPFTFEVKGSHFYSEEKLSAERATGTADISPAGQVTGVTITNPGSNYPTAPAVAFSPPFSGTTATGTATISASGVVTGVTITNHGSGYTSAPSVTFAYPPSVATATATVNLSGAVTALHLTNAGSGYTVPPEVTIATPGGGGTQATATAAINAAGQVTGLTITNPGSGYTSAPTVVIAPPDSAYKVTVSITDNDGGTQVAPFIATLTPTASVTVGDAPLGLLSDLQQQSCLLLTSCNTQANTTSASTPGGIGPASAFPVATFTDLVKDQNGNLACDTESSQPGQTGESIAAHYQASINWGDGTAQDTTTPVIVERGTSCVFDVYGTHTYTGTLPPHSNCVTTATAVEQCTVLTTITDEGGLATSTQQTTDPSTETASVINVVVPPSSPHFSHMTSSMALRYSKIVVGKGYYSVQMSIAQYNNVLNAGTFVGSLNFVDPTLKLSVPSCVLNKYAPLCRLNVLSFYTCGTAPCPGAVSTPKVGTMWISWTVVKTGAVRYARIDVTDPDPATADTFNLAMGSTATPWLAVQSSTPSPPTGLVTVVPSS